MVFLTSCFFPGDREILKFFILNSNSSFIRFGGTWSPFFFFPNLLIHKFLQHLIHLIYTLIRSASARCQALLCSWGLSRWQATLSPFPPRTSLVSIRLLLAPLQSLYLPYLVTSWPCQLSRAHQTNSVHAVGWELSPDQIHSSLPFRKRGRLNSVLYKWPGIV